VDVVESLPIERAKRLFGAEHANVQPHAGAQASAAVLSAFAEPGDAILGLDLAHGGHLTHGMKLNFSGKIYRSIAYHVDADTGLVDMDEVRSLARRRQPAVLIAGWSAYPRHLDFAAFREVADEVGATLWVRYGALRWTRGRWAPSIPDPVCGRRHHDHVSEVVAERVRIADFGTRFRRAVVHAPVADQLPQQVDGLAETLRNTHGPA
jgi:Serine hydroxymethyltransferase